MNLAKFIPFAKERLSFSTQTSPPIVGDIHFAQDTEQMYIFNGNEWVRVTDALLNDRSDMDE